MKRVLRPSVRLSPLSQGFVTLLGSFPKSVTKPFGKECTKEKPTRKET